MSTGQSAITGILTGLVMILTSLYFYKYASSQSNQWQMLIYGIYAAGIWIGQYRYSFAEQSRFAFRNFFSEGFKIFMPVTVLMVSFTWLFITFDSAFVEKTAEAFRNQLLSQGDRTLEQIDLEVARSKDKYATFFTSLAIFGYLIAGALASLSGALFFSSRNKR